MKEHERLLRRKHHPPTLWRADSTSRAPIARFVREKSVLLWMEEPVLENHGDGEKRGSVVSQATLLFGAQPNLPAGRRPRLRAGRVMIRFDSVPACFLAFTLLTGSIAGCCFHLLCLPRRRRKRYAWAPSQLESPAAGLLADVSVPDSSLLARMNASPAVNRSTTALSSLFPSEHPPLPPPRRSNTAPPRARPVAMAESVPSADNALSVLAALASKGQSSPWLEWL